MLSAAVEEDMTRQEPRRDKIEISQNKATTKQENDKDKDKMPSRERGLV
jgi:hypothetical protein